MCKEGPQEFNEHKLNVDKIKTMEDCKNILEFLCFQVLKPIPEDLEYVGFDKVKQYFEE